MKKLIIALSLIGLLVGPITSLQAEPSKCIKEYKLPLEKFFQRLKNDERSKRALKGAQPFFALLTAVGINITIMCAAGITPYSYSKSSAILTTGATALAAGCTVQCARIWHKILKKRMEFSNQEKELLQFFIMDLFERIASIKVVFNLGN